MDKMGNFKQIEGRPPCGICGAPADVQNKLPNGQHIWRKSKDGSFRCYSCHDNTTNQLYLADKYIGSKLTFTPMALKPTTIRINLEASVKAREIQKNVPVKRLGKLKDPQWGRIWTNELTNPKRGGKLAHQMAENFKVDTEAQAKKNKKKTNDKFRSKNKKKKIVSQEVMNKEDFVGNLSLMTKEHLQMMLLMPKLPKAFKVSIEQAIADKKQTAIIMND
jgi:hypothetical protein